MKHESGNSTDLDDQTGETVHEAYSFACMKCGHGWEQDYEIQHLEYTRRQAPGRVLRGRQARPLAAHQAHVPLL